MEDKYPVLLILGEVECTYTKNDSLPLFFSASFGTFPLFHGLLVGDSMTALEGLVFLFLFCLLPFYAFVLQNLVHLAGDAFLDQDLVVRSESKVDGQHNTNTYTHAWKGMLGTGVSGHAVSLFLSCFLFSNPQFPFSFLPVFPSPFVTI